MPMTDEELKGIAAQALNMAKTQIEKGGFNFLLAHYNYNDKHLHRMERIEALIIERLGEDWLGDWRRKAQGFRVIRHANKVIPVDALVFVSAGNGFTATPKFDALPEDEQEALRVAGHAEHHRAVAAGLLTVADILVAIAQTPERVCVYKQELDARYQFTGAPHATFSRQDEFEGNLKMFGTAPGEQAAAS